jgi:hypothetical protein
LGRIGSSGGPALEPNRGRGASGERGEAEWRNWLGFADDALKKIIGKKIKIRKNKFKGVEDAVQTL